ncbi:MAG: efflux RND transporter periplasmic adaptor subunit [Fibrobacter sp.]|nr:efflux RND transporter periplasmic adaptor subunit [Fibrobacter sp.]
MKSSRRFFCFIEAAVFCTFTFTILIFGCSKREISVDESIEQIQKRKGIPVVVAEVHKGTLVVDELLGGTARGYYQTTISSSIAGKLIEIRAKIGDYVEKDSSLMSIEPDHAQNYDVVKQQYENSIKNRQRIRVLAEQGGVSQELIDEVDAQYLKSKEDLDAVRKSQFVLSPFSGTVVNIFQTLNSKLAPGTELITIAQVKKIRIPLKISDKIINKFKVGQKAVAIVDNDSVSGVIENVSLAGNDFTNTFEIEAVFNNAQKLIKPGMHILVRIIIESKNDVITLGSEDIINDGAQKYVYIVNDSLARKAEIVTGKKIDGKYEIVSGISDADLVVVKGASLLYDGAKVNVVSKL